MTAVAPSTSSSGILLASGAGTCVEQTRGERGRGWPQAGERDSCLVGRLSRASASNVKPAPTCAARRAHARHASGAPLTQTAIRPTVLGLRVGCRAPDLASGPPLNQRIPLSTQDLRRGCACGQYAQSTTPVLHSLSSLSVAESRGRKLKQCIVHATRCAVVSHHL